MWQKWKVYIKHFCCTSVVSRKCSLSYCLSSSQFFQELPFYLKEQLTKNYGSSDLDVWQICFWKWTKWACHFKENNWQNLLPVIKFKPSNINQNSENFTHKLEFGKFVSGSVSFMAFQHLKLFPMRLVVILTKLIYLMLYNEMCQYSEKICITQWTSIS